MSFGDAQTVMDDRQKQDWKLTSGTVYFNPDFTSSVFFQYLYVWPNPDSTGIGGTGYPVSGDKITIYREGEEGRPKADDRILVADDGSQYLINAVTSRLNADEDTLGYAVYDCTVTKLTNPE